MTTHINSGVAQRTSQTLCSVFFGQEVGSLTADGVMIHGWYQGMDCEDHLIRTFRDGVFKTRNLFTTYRRRGLIFREKGRPQGIARPGKMMAWVVRVRVY